MTVHFRRRLAAALRALAWRVDPNAHYTLTMTTTVSAPTVNCSTQFTSFTLGQR